MIEIPPPDLRASRLPALGPQPIAIAAAALLLIIAGIGAIFLWRIASGTSPEQERVAGRQVQARVVQTSEQIMERTKGLELTQQQSIDQLQALQDQLQQIERLVSAQRSDTRKLSEQVGEIGASLDSLRQSFAQAQPAETAERPAVQTKPATRVSRGKAKKPRAAKSQRRSTKPRR